MKNGIVYIVFGSKSWKEFDVSIKLLRKIHPDVDITLFTDRKQNNGLVNNEIIIRPKGTRIKQYHLYDSPYENTLYLDATSNVVGPIIDVFGLMERFDLAVVQDVVRKHNKKSKIYPDYASIPDGFPEYSGGIILFKKNSVVENFFNLWCKNFKIWYDIVGEDRDQPSLRVSLWQCNDLKIHTLPPEFSIRTKKYHNITPRIFHIHAATEEKLKFVLADWFVKNGRPMDGIK